MDSTLFQALLTLFWTVTAIGTMIPASRRGHRERWYGGIGLLGVVGAKLLLFDAAGRGTLDMDGDADRRCAAGARSELLRAAAAEAGGGYLKSRRWRDGLNHSRSVRLLVGVVARTHQRRAGAVGEAHLFRLAPRTS